MVRNKIGRPVLDDFKFNFKNYFMYKPGYIYEVSGAKFILAVFTLQNKEYGMLVDLEEGNRWVDPVEVKHMYRITKEEFDMICGGEKAKLVTKKI